MNTRTRVRRTTLAGIGAAAVTTAAVLVGPAAAAAPADETGSPAPAEETATQESGGSQSGDMGDMDALGDWIPQELQQDVENLHDLPVDDQAAELRNIADRALSGEYGDQVQNWIEDMQNAWSGLPSDLRNDLGDAIGQSADEEGDALGQVWEDARSGEYGEAVESWTDWAAGAVSSFSVDSGSSGSD